MNASLKRQLRTPTERWLMLAVLLVAAAFRLVGINNLSPPGLSHDEVANWLIDRSILAGEHAIYFTDAYGHEAGFHYVQAGFVSLIGDNVLALRLPPAFAGLLLVAVCYALARFLFGRRVAVIAAALLAVLFWAVFVSRLGLRSVTLPLVAGLSVYFWWRGWDATQSPGQATRWWALAGALAGLTLHIYMAARAVPIFYAIFFVYLLLFHRQRLRGRWRAALVFWGLMALVASPLIYYLLTTPDAEYRIGEVDEPLRELRKGNIRPIVDNSVDILGMFAVRGDPLWRYNVVPEPVFDPLTGGLFYLCVLLCVIWVRDARYLFLILWVFAASIPSIVTIDAPSGIRMTNMFPVLTILPAIVMHNLGRLSTKSGRLSTAQVDKWGVPLLALLLVGLLAGRTASWIFSVWPANDEVEFIWQEAITDAAGYLDAETIDGPVAIGGWTPESMDPPTMELTLRRDDLVLRHFQPQVSLVVPTHADGPARILHPTVLPLAPSLAAELASWGATLEAHGTFVEYHLDAAVNPAPEFPASVSFGDELLFLGHSFEPDCNPDAGAGACHILTYWRVLAPAAGPRRIFLHTLDDNGEVVAAGDGLGAPAEHWQPGDLIVQRHELSAEAVLAYTLSLGIYNPESLARVPASSGGDRIPLAKSR